MPFGLRPSDPGVTLGPPIDIAHGANPDTNLVVLEVPEVLVVDQAVAIWNDLKKPSNVVLVFDKSGSMQGEKIAQALDGAVDFVKEMGRKDWLFWLPFDTKIYPGTKGRKEEVGEQLQSEILSTIAFGETSLYDAIARAYQELEGLREGQGDTARYGIVILSDGKNFRLK